MIEVSIMVTASEGYFQTSVRAENIQSALSLIESHYPGRDVQVLFPIDPESFFVRTSSVELLDLRVPAARAG